METSDSEYFESADEDFQSDDEDTKTVRSVKSEEKSDLQCVKQVTTQIKEVQLTRTHEETVDIGFNHNKNCENPKLDNVHKDDENNVNKNKKSEVKECAKIPETSLAKNSDNIQKELQETVNEKSLKVPTPKENVIVKTSINVVNPDRPKTLPNIAENLWDDCEIDWAKEEDTEENEHTISDKKTENPKCSKRPTTPPVKEEENLWDDSEVDWGKEKEEDNMWDNDDWEPVEEPQQQKPHSEEKVPQTNNSGWGSWGNWGVSSILSTATQGVSTITQGITTVLETGMGVPEPEELARINQAEKEKLKELSQEGEQDKSSGFGLGNFVMGVSHLTKLVETTSTKVISGGLDTLETIGKKTMEVLQEGDPGLKKKRAFLKIDQDKPVLSQLLREAKEKAEEENKILEQKHFAKKAKNYETLFDDHQGLVHLEALEMLSKQCDIKLQTLLESYTDDSLIEMQETMDQVKELCELPDEDDDDQAVWTEILEKLNSAVSEINIPISYKKLIDTWEETETWLNNLKLEICDERELHQQAVETLAQLTAIAVEQFHKAGELLLVKEHRSTADEADSLVQLTTSLTSLIGIVAAKFSDRLNAKSSNSKNKEIINSLITNVFFEAANSSSYIQDAFQLLIPVLQVGAV